LLKLAYSNKFKKDYNKIKKELSFEDMSLLFEVIRKVRSGEKLEDKFVDHKLNNSKDYKECRDCHIKPDLVLIYRICDETLQLVRLNTHSELGL
jgi:mRNA interferase YafQ